MSMKQTIARVSSYSADVFGACSALFELGGMIVIHDPSGCNSTYATHDEPRWYDMDSLFFISGLTEIDAVMGNDDKLIHDIVSAAQDLSPRFIAVLQSPIPYMIGTDLEAVAKLVQKKTGIMTFALQTNSMHSYVKGASMAFAMLAEHMIENPEGKILPPLTPKRWSCSWQAEYTTDGSLVKDMPAAAVPQSLGVNILGVTPLDFSFNGSDQSMVQVLRERGFRVISIWAMGSSLENIVQASLADVNLVVSYAGLEAARILQRRFSIPYVIGVPFGSVMAAQVASDLKESAAYKTNIISYRNRKVDESGTVIVGESIYSASLAWAIAENGGPAACVFCPLDTETALLVPEDRHGMSEGELEKLLFSHNVIIADPLYHPICPATARFVPLPHEAFSGRLFRKEIPNLIKSAEAFAKNING
ncbi:MAG: nitrogenase component 1 [Megasphaera sp.]|uniref:nitrogenase component 1 n=1 Tax=Megasphaera sueciensis TaxID=349094 RepID=UPI003CFF79A7|nr:nitrogenase component 1 [Megasphaera sp.]